MGTQKYFYSPDVNVVSQGGTQEGNPSSSTCNLGVHRFGGPVVTPHKGRGGGPADICAAAQHRARDDAFALHPKGFKRCAKSGPALFSTYNPTIALP